MSVQSSSLKKIMLDLFFPPKCMICGKITDDRAFICPRCKSALPETVLGGKLKPEFVEETAVPFYYRGKLADAVKKFKFNSCRDYSVFFAASMADCISEKLSGKFDVITWVPISDKRLRVRGYDQSAILAAEIGRILEKPAVPLLTKLYDNRQQSLIEKPEARKANVLGAYKALPEANDKRVLLIDDIITTGSTMSECARSLLMAGAQLIYGSAIATTK